MMYCYCLVHVYVAIFLILMLNCLENLEVCVYFVFVEVVLILFNVNKIYNYEMYIY